MLSAKQTMVYCPRIAFSAAISQKSTTCKSKSQRSTMISLTLAIICRSTKLLQQIKVFHREPPYYVDWASLVTQTVKNPPAMQETWVRSLGWEDPPEEGMATHSCILAWRIPTDRGAWQAKSMGWQRVGHDWATKYILDVFFFFKYLFIYFLGCTGCATQAL